MSTEKPAAKWVGDRDSDPQGGSRGVLAPGTVAGHPREAGASEPPASERAEAGRVGGARFSGRIFLPCRGGPV